MNPNILFDKKWHLYLLIVKSLLITSFMNLKMYFSSCISFLIHLCRDLLLLYSILHFDDAAPQKLTFQTSPKICMWPQVGQHFVSRIFALLCFFAHYLCTQSIAGTSCELFSLGWPFSFHSSQGFYFPGAKVSAKVSSCLNRADLVETGTETLNKSVWSLTALSLRCFAACRADANLSSQRSNLLDKKVEE